MGTDGTLTASVLGSSTGTVRTLPSCVRARACCHAACARNRVYRQQNSRRAAAGAASETVASLRQPAYSQHASCGEACIANAQQACWQGSRSRMRPAQHVGDGTNRGRAPQQAPPQPLIVLCAPKFGRRPASCSCRSARVPSRPQSTMSMVIMAPGMSPRMAARLT